MTNVIDLHSERMKQGEFNKANHNSTKGKMTMQMSKRNVTNLFKALDFAITNAEDLNLDRQELEEIKKKIEGAMVKACLEAYPDDFAQLADGRWNSVKHVKAWGYVRRADGRWHDPNVPTPTA